MLLGTLQRYIAWLNKRFLGPSNVYPTLDAGITVTGSATANTLGANITVVDEDIITSDFVINEILVSAISVSDVYELVLYSGESGHEVEIGRTKFAAIGYAPINTGKIVANSRISAKIASITGGSDTATIFLIYSV